MYLNYLALVDQNLLSPFLLSSDSKIKEHETLVLFYMGEKVGFPTLKDCKLKEF